jgi:hypothetical protein
VWEIDAPAILVYPVLAYLTGINSTTMTGWGELKTPNQSGIKCLACNYGKANIPLIS